MFQKAAKESNPGSVSRLRCNKLRGVHTLSLWPSSTSKGAIWEDRAGSMHLDIFAEMVLTLISSFWNHFATSLSLSRALALMVRGSMASLLCQLAPGITRYDNKMRTNRDYYLKPGRRKIILQYLFHAFDVAGLLLPDELFCHKSPPNC